MADLDDLGYKSITEMSTDEAIELLRQIRLGRRTPAKKVAKAKTKDPKVSAEQAAELLKLLTGED